VHRYLIGTAVVAATLGAATVATGTSKRGFEQSFALPKGVRLDISAHPRCKAGNARIASLGGSACSARSRVGSGHATLRLAAKGTPDIDATVTIFNARRQLILVLDPAGANVQVLRAKLRHRRLHLKLPVLCAPTGTKPKCGPRGNVRIVRLDLTVDGQRFRVVG
jgi:hypothetical protein